MFQNEIQLTPEFGNVEQINALREYDKLFTKFTNGVVPECDYEVRCIATFRCICGFNLDLETPAEGENDISCFEGKTKTCYHCNKHYQFVIKKSYRIYSGRRFYDEELVVVLKEKIN